TKKEPVPASPPPAAIPRIEKILEKRAYSSILEKPQFEDLLKKLDSATIVGFDTECVGLEPMSARLVGMSFAFGREAFYLPLAHESRGAPAQLPMDETLARLKPWLEREDCRKVAQNVEFDSHVLANLGIRLAGCEHDTLLESYVFEVHERHDLGTLALRHCG